MTNLLDALTFGGIIFIIGFVLLLYSFYIVSEDRRNTKSHRYRLIIASVFMIGSPLLVVLWLNI